MDKNIFELLACPLHQDNDLIFDNILNVLHCQKCNKNYEMIENGSSSIPNFLFDDTNWKKGIRDINSSLIETFQGFPFKRELEDNKLILDVGCGENPRGNINLDCYIPQKIPQNFVLGNAEYLPFKKNSVDIVLSYYNIEHLINPAIFIQKMYDIAREKLEIVTDNDEWIGDIFFRVLGVGRIFHDEHYYKWSVEYFKNLINRLGYSKNKIYLLNLSTNRLVKLTTLLGVIPRVGNMFYRDLKAEIWK